MTVYVLQYHEYESSTLVAIYQDEDMAISEQKRSEPESDWHSYTVTPMEVK